jgi:hypothetical protein
VILRQETIPLQQKVVSFFYSWKEDEEGKNKSKRKETIITKYREIIDGRLRTRTRVDYIKPARRRAALTQRRQEIFYLFIFF